ncbi:MAG: hypothetical protein KAU41_12490 [Deltaproteobacteria bacterium]|nr:hypothetical protein [Deltaproteobacteria bacterium]
MTPEVINGLFAIGGALVGAVVSGLFALYLAKRTKEKSELTVLATRPTRLITIGKEIEGDVEITIAGEKVDALYMMDFTVLNSGTEVLEQIEVPFQIDSIGKILNFAFYKSNFPLKEEGKAVERIDSNNIQLHVDYLNPGEQLTGRAIISKVPDAWKAMFRKPGVNLVTREDLEGTVPDLLLRAFFEGIKRNFILDAYFKLALPQYKRYRDLERENR